MNTFARLLIIAITAITVWMPASAEARRGDGSCPGNSCNAPGQQSQTMPDQNQPMQHQLMRGRSDFKGNLKTRQHIYYAGDPLEVSIKFSRGWNLLADGTAVAHIVVILPNTSMFSVPVERSIGGNDRMFFDFTVTTETLPAGQYQLGLIVTIPDGDPTNLQDWYSGFRGLLDMEGIYISAESLPEDANGDGECDYDTDGDGFCDDQSMGDNDDNVDDDGAGSSL